MKNQAPSLRPLEVDIGRKDIHDGRLTLLRDDDLFDQRMHCRQRALVDLHLRAACMYRAVGEHRLPASSDRGMTDEPRAARMDADDLIVLRPELH